MNTEEKLRERAAVMHESELVLWLYVFEHMTQIEGRLEVMVGPAPPDPFGNMSPAAVQEILRAELARRSAAKGSVV